MCGIAGFVGAAGARAPDFDALQKMARAISHRGPDGEGFFEAVASTGHKIGLAHRRLAIIDLHTGAQPIGNETGRVQIVFNGEIYNFQALREELVAFGHSFRTASDTEVIVHAYEQWGPDCVRRLRGMFTFAIWDADQDMLVLARDRYGKKPLFLLRDGETLLFASEIKSLLAVPGVTARLDHRVLRDYLTYRYVPAPRTLFAGIEKLLPGCVAVWKKGKLDIQRYFQPADRAALLHGPLPADPPAAFLDALDEAVRIRMVADVPFGAFLSGGLDSSAVVALMSRHSQMPVKTYSVGFAEAAYSELAYARTIANHFRTDHHELVVSQQDMIDRLPELVGFRDAPVAEPSDIPIYLLSREARRTVKMVLTGEGSDEFLGGYPKHVYERYAAALSGIPGIRSMLPPLARRLPYAARRVKTAAETMAIGDWRTRMPRWFGAMATDEAGQLLARPATLADADEPQFDVVAGNSPLRAILYFDQTSWLPDNLLERGDRMTMAASIEARMPFMDHELAALVSGWPDEWRVKGRSTKRVLRMAMRRLLPAPILERPKVGFRVPVNEWFRGPMREFLLDHLQGSRSQVRSYLDQVRLDTMVRQHLEGRQNHEKSLWMLLNLEIWHRRFGVAA